MVEAFRKHLPIWVILTGALVVTTVLVYFVFDNNRAVEEEPSVPAGQEASEGALAEEVALEEFASGFTAPVDIISTGQEGDSRLFVVEQGGTIKILEDGQIAEMPVLDISEQVIFQGEQGLLGMEFSPDLEHLYVNYVRTGVNGRETVIARYALNENQTQADTNSSQEVLTVSQPFANHNGGDLAFGPDGYLYIALGDGGSGGDPQNNAQNTNTLLGKILRIDVSENLYDTPQDNPFTSQDGRGEIWHWGLRNPWRISFDSEGNMWIGDVGQGEFEEINFQPAGESGQNYGWRCYEAASEYNPSGCGERAGYVMPVASYEHTGSGCTGSVTGGHVYEGETYPGLRGDYIFADYCTGTVYRLDSNDREAGIEVVLETDYGITGFGVGSSGELYVADAKSGTIYQVVAE